MAGGIRNGRLTVAERIITRFNESSANGRVVPMISGRLAAIATRSVVSSTQAAYLFVSNDTFGRLPGSGVARSRFLAASKNESSFRQRSAS